MNSYLHTHYKSGAATPNYWLPGYKKSNVTYKYRHEYLHEASSFILWWQSWQVEVRTM